MKKLFHLFSFLFQNVEWKMRLLAVVTLSGLSQMPPVFSRYSSKALEQPKEMAPISLSALSSQSSKKKQHILGTFHVT